MATRLKMVAGDTFMSPPIFGPETVVRRNEEIEVKEEKDVETLLNASYNDALNNKHFYFAEVGSEAAPLDAEGRVPPKSRRVRHVVPAGKG